MGKAGRLLLLGLGQAAVVAGAVLAGQFVILEGHALEGTRANALAVLVLFGIPAWLLIPLLGRIPKLATRQTLLRWASMLLVLVCLPFLFLQDHWLLWWALVSLALALVLPLRASLLGLAARDVSASVIRLTTIGLFYTLAAAFIGWILGLALIRLEGPGLPLPMGYALALFALGLASTLFSPFPGDLAVRPDRRHATSTILRQLWQAPTFRWALPAGALLRGGLIALLAWLLLASSSANPPHAVTLFLFGAGIATLITTIQAHPRRLLGLFPFALSAFAILLFLQSRSQHPLSYFSALGWIAGFLVPALHNALFLELEDGEHLSADLLRRGLDFACAGLWGLLLFALSWGAELSSGAILVTLALPALIAALLTWYFRRREAVELVFELVMIVFYRTRVSGPGIERFPRRGPVLVIANHACWFDPILLGQALPRTIIPMMTSVFYDLPIMRWLMVHFGQPIRVEAGRSFRRDIPELREAVAVLDRGDVLVVFPEGAMRRRAEQWLKHFGQGIVHILRERPDTLIIPCWIEGNWGSYFSYAGGPPTKNKRMDIRRDIRIAVAEPRLIDPVLLENHREARAALMEAVIETRALLGLEVPPLERDIGTAEEVEA